MQDATYIPSNAHLGGPRTSNSQLATLARCRQEFFLSYLAPHPMVERGEGLISTTTSDGLITGRLIHAGLHAYRVSGWRDGADSGEYDPDAATAAIDALAPEVERTSESVEQAEANLGEAKLVLLKYHEELAAGRYLDLRLVADANGEPVVEREFYLPIGSYVYVDRIDAMLAHSEYHLVGEYKTSNSRYVWQELAGLHLRGQSYGHMAVLLNECPTAPIRGLYFGVFATRRGKASKVPLLTERSDVVVPAASVEAYLRQVGTTLDEVQQRIGAWQGMVEDGWDSYSAGVEMFPLDGLLNGMCRRYNRLCDYAVYCENHGMGSRMLSGMRPRTVAGEPYQEESKEHASTDL